MKLNKLYSKPLRNPTLKIMGKNGGETWKFTLKKPGKIMEISWNFVSLKKWESCCVLVKFYFINYAVTFRVNDQLWTC